MGRNKCFDVLKGIAIIAVVLYHLGWCPYGYLGVDIFLVIAGYMTIQSVENQILTNNNGGGYVKFIFNRVFRLLPLLLIAGLVCLIFGWFLMLPDDYENVAQSIVATNFFGNNILACITTKNYWAIVNEYKPLMHTWYVGLIMQFYVTVPFLLFLTGRYFTSSRRPIFIGILSVVGFCSLLMYLFVGSDAQKFYYLPFRLYEFCAGGLIYCAAAKHPKTTCSHGIIGQITFVMLYLLLLFLLFVNIDISTSSVRLLMIVASTSAILYRMVRYSLPFNVIFSNKYLAALGVASYSIFVWHQVIFALTRYSFTSTLSAMPTLLIIMAITAALSYLTYKYVESIRKSAINWAMISIMLLLTTGASLFLYKEAGVVRDIPELDVVRGQTERGMWAKYCDRGYDYDKEFADNDKPKWFVIGNSFGRDWVNVILESAMANKVDISYSVTEKYVEHERRFLQADVVFLSTLGLNEELIEDIQQLCADNTRFYIVGEKNFGECNGQIYRHRFSTDYHELTIPMEDGYASKNDKFRSLYPQNYIDLIAMVQQSDGQVRVFSDDGRYISQDCHHLTQAGAQYYAQQINWDNFLQ